MYFLSFHPHICNDTPPRRTWNPGGELCDDWRAKAFHSGRSYCEGIGGAWVEAAKHVSRLIGQFEDLAALIGQVKVGVEGAQGFVVNLWKRKMGFLFLMEEQAGGANRC